MTADRWTVENGVPVLCDEAGPHVGSDAIADVVTDADLVALIEERDRLRGDLAAAIATERAKVADLRAEIGSLIENYDDMHAEKIAFDKGWQAERAKVAEAVALIEAWEPRLLRSWAIVNREGSG